MIDQQKKQLRLEMSAVRAALSAQMRDQAALAVAQTLLPWLQTQQDQPSIAGESLCVAGYWPMGQELDPRPAMADLDKAGIGLCLPVVEQRQSPLIFRRYHRGEALQDGPHGTKHPAPDQPICRPNVVLVPLLAFDELGFRLGYGGGYYDRTLSLLRLGGETITIGLGYAAQQRDRLPHDRFDQRLDAVLTELGLTRFTRS